MINTKKYSLKRFLREMKTFPENAQKNIKFLGVPLAFSTWRLCKLEEELHRRRIRAEKRAGKICPKCGK